MNEIILPKMTEAEARRCADEIKVGIFNVGKKLLELYEGGGWEALGYASWRECAQMEFGFSQSYAYRLLSLEEVKQNIIAFSPMGESSILPANERQLRPLVSLPADIQPIAWQRAIETAPDGKLTGAHVQRVADEYKQPTPTVIYEWTEPAQEVPALSNVEGEPEPDSDEYYTPQYIIAAVRGVLGNIDLDPASCELAQTVVQAGEYYSKADDGLIRTWHGRVFMNPPFSKPQPFVVKMIEEYEAGNVESGILLVNNGTETRWGQALLSRFPVCFVGANVDRGSRISFWSKDPDQPKTGNRYAQMIFYMGQDGQKFFDVFSQFGTILNLWHDR